MSIRGRRPKPSELRERQGNPGNRPVPDDPAPEAAVVEPEQVSRNVPEGLTGRAAEVWAEVAPLLAALRFVRASDLQALKRYCVWVATWWGAAEDVGVNGSHYETKSPHVDRMLRLNPAFTVMRVAEDRCQDLEDRFGFNPSARMRIASALASGKVNDRPLPGMEDERSPGDRAATPEPTSSAPGSALGALNRGGSIH